jgi:predicted LPLAT superfamily acyltransferase
MNEWITARERGTSWTISFMIWLCRGRHRWLVNLLLYPITAYFFITGRTAHRASTHFFTLAKGQARWSDYYRQLLYFSRCLVDRVTILIGDADRFEVHPSGREALMETRQDGRGMIMLGSHLGNFEACKLFAIDRMDMDIHIVAYFSGSTKIRRALDAINPELQQNFIDPTEPDAVFRMRDVIDSGGILAILGDRIGIGEKKAQVNFMGETAYLPTGPYYLASILHCPVFCFFGLRVDHYVYDTYAIKLAEHIALARGQREQQAQVYAQQYADLLAEKAREYPYNWFNFYEFWNLPTGAKP